ncbi:MAG: HIRAN domain-containing protein [Vicinamibacteria bacterium]
MKGDYDHDELEERARQEQLGRRWEWVRRGKDEPDAPAFIGASVKLEELRRFVFEIVGESKYQENLWRIAQTAHPEYGARVVEPAYLVLEDENPYDNNAVRVDMMSLTVGYLSREKAVWYRRLLAAGRVPTACHGRISGGFPRDDGGTASLGVVLDLEAKRLPRKRKGGSPG